MARQLQGRWAFVKADSIRRKQIRSKDWLEYIPAPLHAWVLPILLVAVWQAAGSLQLIAPNLLPTPVAISKQFFSLVQSGTLWEHFAISTFRALSGFLLGGLTGLFLGLFTGLGKMAERTLDPSVQMLRTIPLLSLIPLFILWFGIGEFSKILMISLGAFFPVYVNTFLGIRSVDVKLYDVSRIFQYSKIQLLTRLILPAALPNILLGIRLALGVAWLVLVVAEMMGTSSGIGYMIQDARAYSQTDIVFVGIIIFAIIGKLSDSIVRMLESRLLRWRETYKG
ncbi:ABC transporter permease [Paenibacillus gallinarum]|uniref:ABC transporter permease n=1 Tax=Paenibacillus gallinarum TaxID=2762232 RepID=A0ABR8T1H2_9BACL|nr:ABC transporter permease [Paenibacillus gallinarum]